MMKLFYIMGFSHSGKSTLINTFFTNEEQYVHVDVLDYENVYADPMKNISLARVALNSSINIATLENKDIVLEAPSLTRKQREFFLRRINKWTNNIEIIGIWVTADDDTIIQRIDQSGNNGKEILEYQHELVEYPSIDEKFNVLYKYTNTGVDTDEEYIIKQAKYHCNYTGDDACEAYALMKDWTQRSDRHAIRNRL